MCSNLFETLAVHLPSFSSGNLILSKQNPQLQQYNESNNASPSLLLTVEWTTSQRDLKLDSKRKFTYAAHVVLSPSSSSAAAAATADSKEHFSPILVAGPFGQEAPPNVVWSMTNSSGRLRASFRQGVVADKDSPKKRRFIEISDGQRITSLIEVTDKHGDFYVGDIFGGFSWSNNDEYIVYVAEKVPPKDGIEKHCSEEDFGEGFTKKKSPTLFLVHLPLANVFQIATPDFFPGQPIISEDGSYIVCVGINGKTPIPYGTRYCHNRLTVLYSICVDSSYFPSKTSDLLPLLSDFKITALTNDLFPNARSPRLLPGSTSKIVFLSNAANGPHFATSQLNLIDIHSLRTNVVVPIIPDTATSPEFAGLYIDNLPVDCWASSSSSTGEGETYLICSTRYKSREVIISIHIESGTVTNQTPLTTNSLDSYSSYSVLSVKHGYILTTKSNITDPGSLLLGKAELRDGISLTRISSLLPPPAPTGTNTTDLNHHHHQILSEIDWEIKSFTSARGGGAFEAILVMPKEGDKCPLIVFPHGGPHSGFTTDFSWIVASMCASGFAVLMVNYTGSVGFGEDCITKLLGRIGDIDLDDVHSAAKAVIHEHGGGRIDGGKVGLFGGSHGGFITAFLVGMYPDFYQAGVLRNPVINVGSMVATSDIPDWCYIESGLDFNLSNPPILSPQQYKTMFSKSPASVAHLVTSPVLVMLGEGDRRVPPMEGLRWGQYLKSNGVDATIVKFNEVGHALDSVPAEKYGFDCYMDFLKKHLMCV